MPEGPRFEAAIDALLAEAAAEGPRAVVAARRAAHLAEGRDPARAARAHALAAKLDPLDAFPRLALARLHAETGDVDAARREAAAVFSEALDQAARARAAFILGELARARGDVAEARQAYAAAAHIEESMLSGDGADPVAARWYARSIGRIAELDARDDFAKARRGAEGAVSILRALTMQIGEPPMLAADIADAEFRMAAFALDAGEAGAARQHISEAIGRYEALILAEPDEPHWRAVLADAWTLAAEASLSLGAPDNAVGAIDNALKLRLKLARHDPAERGALAAVWRLRGAMFGALGDSETATHSLSQAAALAKMLHDEAPRDAMTARFIVQTLLEQTDQALARGAIEIARDAASAARTIAEPFAQSDGGDAWFEDLAAAWDRLGRVSRAVGAPAQARDSFARAAAFQRKVYAIKPNDDDAKRALSSALLITGDAALAARQYDNARSFFVEAFQLRLELAEAAPGEPEPARALAVALERLGLAAAASGDSVGARAVWEEELALIERVYEDPCDIEGQRFRAVIEAHLAGLNGLDSAELRASALARLDLLAEDGKLTERDEHLRVQLWRGAF